MCNTLHTSLDHTGVRAVVCGLGRADQGWSSKDEGTWKGSTTRQPRNEEPKVSSLVSVQVHLL